jgi:hypothetical protein
MAILIDILSDDCYLCELLRLRLTPMFPGAYIEPAGSSLCEELRQICDRKICLYDNRTYVIKDDPSVPIFGDGSISGPVDCEAIRRQLEELMSDIREEAAVSSLTGRSHILLPFTYINDREAMIEKEFSPFTSDSDLTVRIDLMSGIRMPLPIKNGPDDSSLDRLLIRAGHRDFRPEDILEYCNPDIKGFMTPGRPSEPDSVFDHDRQDLISLLKAMRDLSAAGGQPTVTALCVIEGFRMSDTCELIRYADNIHILLPSDDASGLSGIPSIIERAAQRGQKVIVHYSKDYMRGDTNEARSI